MKIKKKFTLLKVLKMGLVSEVLPLQKEWGGAEKVLAMLKGGGHKKF